MQKVSCKEACECVCEERCPCPGADDGGGKMKASTVPTFLEALAQQFAAKYGSDAVSFLEKAAVAGIEALAEKFDIVVKPAI